MKSILILATLALLSGCGEPEGTGGGKLDGGRFQTKINGTPVTIELDPGMGRFSGRVVNRFFGSYEVSDDKITFSQVASTLMLGPPDAAEAEGIFFMFLPQVESYSMKDDRLVLKTSTGAAMKFTRVD